MKPKQLIALSIITLVIVGALFAIHKYTQKKEEKKSLEKRIFTRIDWNEIHQIVFQSADEREPVVLERVQLPEKDKSGPGKWKIVSPIQDEVNQTKIESIWSTLKELESLESFTLPPDADLKEYFTTIPHGKLMKCMSRRIADKKILQMIKLWLISPVEEIK